MNKERQYLRPESENESNFRIYNVNEYAPIVSPLKLFLEIFYQYLYNRFLLNHGHILLLSFRYEKLLWLKLRQLLLFELDNLSIVT